MNPASSESNAPTAPTSHDSRVNLASSTDPTADDVGLFEATWGAKDHTALLPAHLTRQKVQHAWERKPQSPFSRRRLKIGKVWKRSGNNSLLPLHAPAPTVTIPHVSPVKAIKKMRLESGFGVGARVRDWEHRGSPAARRRILTRSSLLRGDEDNELIALAEESELEDNGEDVTVQVIHQDGSVESADAEDIGNNEWSDVEEEEGSQSFDDTLMHLGEAVAHSAGLVFHQEDTAETAEATLQAVAGTDQDEECPTEECPTTCARSVEPSNEIKTEAVESENGPALALQPTASTPQVNSVQAPLPSLCRPVVLPEGFVSPAAVRRPRSIKHARLSSASRRNTLPLNFAVAAVNVKSTNSAEPEAIAEESSDDQIVDADVDHSPVDTPMESLAEDQEWEDIETDEATGEEDNAAASQVSAVNDPPTLAETMQSTEQANEVYRRLEDGQTLGAASTAASPHKSTPPDVVSAAHQHSPLPVRRSPRRRQTTSPVKQSSIWPDPARTPLIAFTPIKMPITLPPTASIDTASCSPITGTPAHQETIAMNARVPSLPRSASAPPEEAHILPQKPKQPRISDDTALLQAFLNRAAESKTSRRMSETARRESLENRRDSDSVRRALASGDPKPAPAPPVVLADLDPNSPSPRKSSNNAQLSDSLVTSKPQDIAEDDDNDHTLTSPLTTSSSRRSGRVKKKPETLTATTYAAPSKISIRGTADSVVLKRSEAQELSLLTRANTRKNKGGAVLPPQRMAKLAKESSPGRTVNPDQAEAPQSPNANSKSVQWAERLVAFHHFDGDSEESLVVEEPSEIIAQLPATHTNDNALRSSTMPAPAETPSKPRLRRPKPHRVSLTTFAQPVIDGASSTTVEETTAALLPSAESRPKQTKRRSRIATPAKPRKTPVLPYLAEAEELSQTPAPVSSHRKAVSKLPAPASSSSAGTASLSNLGKEGSLIASPPKKRTQPTPPSAASKSGAAAVATRSTATTLDLSNSTIRLDAVQQSDEQDAPSLSSPAKKGSGVFIFGGDGSTTFGKSREVDDLSVPSLGSPAKKRSRRLVR